MRVSIERRSFTGRFGSTCRTAFCKVSPSDSGGMLARMATKDGVVGAKNVGIVNRTLGYFFGESGLLYSAYNADNGEGLSVIPSVGAFEQATANGGFVRPVIPREILIHDTNAVRGARIGVCKKASCQQGKTHGAKIVSGNAVRVVPSRRFARAADVSLHRGRALAGVSTEGDVVDYAGGRYAR